MKPLLTAILMFLFSANSFCQTEGATITFKISTEFTTPGATYFVNGNTQAGKEPVTLKLSIKNPKGKEEVIDIISDKNGFFHAELLAPNVYGKYNLTVVTADKINKDSKELWVLDADAIQEEFEKEMAATAIIPLEGLKEADNLAALMPPSTAKTEYNEKSKALKEQLETNKKQLKETSVAFSKYVKSLGKVPEAYAKAIPYLNKIKDQQKEFEENEKNFKQKLEQSKTKAAYCESLNFLVEAAGFISLYLNFEGKLLSTMKNLLSDKAIPGAIDRHDWGSVKGQQQEDYKLMINTSQKTAFALTDKMDGLVKFMKTGASLDLFQYCGKAVYGKFCEELAGPFTGTFRADFDAGGGKGLWHYYEMNMKGKLTLRYEKGGDAKKGFAVKGEFEGVYTGYKFWEDFEKVETVPAGMTLISRDRIMATPIDVSNIPIPKVTAANGKTTVSTGSLNIYNDLGLIARQMMPGSFIIKVKGKVINEKIYLSIDKEALVNQKDLGQKNQLVLVMVQPLLPIPMVKVFDFPMAPAKSIFAVGIGDQQIIELKNDGKQTLGVKDLNNMQKLENGDIVVRTKLNIKVGNDSN